jgi:hypothetical protein
MRFWDCNIYSLHSVGVLEGCFVFGTPSGLFVCMYVLFRTWVGMGWDDWLLDLQMAFELIMASSHE